MSVVELCGLSVGEFCLMWKSLDVAYQADAILTLASSNGRSWSTTYSPRPAAKPTNSMSEGSMSAVEREKEHSVQSLGGSLALSSEVQTLLRDLKQSGTLTGRSA